jgi:hypothetical protein
MKWVFIFAAFIAFLVIFSPIKSGYGPESYHSMSIFDLEEVEMLIPDDLREHFKTQAQRVIPYIGSNLISNDWNSATQTQREELKKLLTCTADRIIKQISPSAPASLECVSTPGGTPGPQVMGPS